MDVKEIVKQGYDKISYNYRSDYGRFMPFLCTVFFFILINNLLGLFPIFPGGANVTVGGVIIGQTGPQARELLIPSHASAFSGGKNRSAFA